MKYIFTIILFNFYLMCLAQKSFYEPIQHKAFSKSTYSNTTIKTNQIIIHVKPNVCKRCEGTINPTIDKLKSLDSSLRFTLIITGNNIYELNEYVHNTANLKYNKLIFDTNDIIHDYVSNYTGRNSIPIFYKLDTSGWIINWLPTLGINLLDTFMLQDFLNTDKKPLIETDNQLQESVPFPYSRKCKNKVIASNLVNVSSNFAISSNNDIAYVDGVTNDIVVVSQNKKKKLPKTSLEIHGIVDPLLSEYLYDYLKSLYLFHTIYLKLEFLDSKHLLVYTSLPKISVIKNGEDYELDYYNAPIIFLKEISSGNTSILDSTIYNSDTFSTMHNKAIYDGIRFIFPIQKGWPVQGYDEISTYERYKNPLEKDFYHNTPLLVHHRNNKIDTTVFMGSIEPIYINHKTGYFFTNPTMSIYENNLFMNTGFTDFTYRINLSNYHIDTLYTPINYIINFGNESKYKISINTADGFRYKNIQANYTNEQNIISNIYQLSKNFSVECIELLANKEYIYFLVKSKRNEYFIRKYSINKQAFIGSIQLPHTINETNIAKYFTIKFKNNKINIFGIYMHLSEYSVYEMEIDI